MRTGAHAGRSAVGAFRDNLEAVAFALVMALLLRHFCVEVFKIPTASMYPTLRGDSVSPPAVGDRIIVDKWAYLFDHPRRWHVPVFKFPLDRSRNFIKRVGFEPGEEGRMERGDLWVRPAGSEDRFLVARKPRDVRETLYVPIYPPEDAGDDVDLSVFGRDRDAEAAPRLDAALERPTAAEREAALDAIASELGLAVLPLVRERADALPPLHPAARELAALDARLSERARLRHYWRGSEGRTERWRLDSYGRFDFLGGPSEALVYAFSITDTTHASEGSRSTSGTPVVDVRARLSIEPQGPGAVEISWRPGDGRSARLRVATAEKDPSSLRTGTEESTFGARLAIGRATEVELEYVDGDARAWVGGREVAVLKDDIAIDEAVRLQGGESDERQELRIAVEGAAARVTAVRVDHDLYYHSGRNDPSFRPSEGASVVVPEGSYFLLGDNTRSSHDSRRWTANGVRLKPGRADGLTEIWWDSQNGPRYGSDEPGDPRGTRKTVVDLDGISRTWHAVDEDDPHLSKAVPFVTRDLVVGRAFFALVFWPIEEVPRRFRLIH